MAGAAAAAAPPIGAAPAGAVIGEEEELSERATVGSGAGSTGTGGFATTGSGAAGGFGEGAAGHTRIGGRAGGSAFGKWSPSDDSNSATNADKSLASA